MPCPCVGAPVTDPWDSRSPRRQSPARAIRAATRSDKNRRTADRARPFAPASNIVDLTEEHERDLLQTSNEVLSNPWEMHLCYEANATHMGTDRTTDPTAGPTLVTMSPCVRRTSARMKKIIGIGNSTCPSGTESRTRLTGAMPGSGHHVSQARNVTEMTAARKAATATAWIRGMNLADVKYSRQAPDTRPKDAPGHRAPPASAAPIEREDKRRQPEIRREASREQYRSGDARRDNERKKDHDSSGSRTGQPGQYRAPDSRGQLPKTSPQAAPGHRKPPASTEPTKRDDKAHQQEIRKEGKGDRYRDGDDRRGNVHNDDDATQSRRFHVPRPKPDPRFGCCQQQWLLCHPVPKAWRGLIHRANPSPQTTRLHAHSTPSRSPSCGCCIGLRTQPILASPFIAGANRRPAIVLRSYPMLLQHCLQV